MDWLARMETFIRVVEMGSLSRAARSLRLSLPAVSRQLTSLDAELGRPLSIRTTRKFVLTTEGERFYEHARRALAEVDLAKQTAKRGGSVAGPLVVSASVAFGTEKLVPALPALLRKHPRLQLEVRLEEHAADLVDEGIDVAIRAGMPLPDLSGLTARPLAPVARLFVASPDYLARHGEPRDPQELTRHAVIAGMNGGRDVIVRYQATRPAPDEGSTPASVSLAPRLRIGTLLGLREACIAGLGVAILTDFVAARPLRDRQLVQVLPGFLLPERSVHALYRVENRGAPRVAAFIEFLTKL